VLTPIGAAIAVVTAASLLLLTILGMLAAYTGGASLWLGAGRVAFWGALAMALSAGVGALFGVS
jgi:VIT1/CCC1 family predicted Fe2+/Mn2+ transporter